MQYDFFGHATRGTIKAHARLRQSTYRGAFELETHAYNTKGNLGSRQQRTADDLQLEAKGKLTRDLYAAGWHTEQMTRNERTIVLWWPPVQL